MVGWTLQVAFPSLNSLTIRGLDNVKKIWPNQIPQDSFSKLEFVTVLSCGQLLNIFPSCMLKRLQSLMVDNCSSLEAVFDVEGTNVNVDLEELNVDDGHVELLPKLGELRLIGLPKLRHICNCGSSRNHFPSSTASAPVGNIIFPKLIYISLLSLPNLASFSPGYNSLQRLHHVDLDTPFPVLFDEMVSLSLRILLFLVLMILISLLTLLSIKLLEENKENLDWAGSCFSFLFFFLFFSFFT